MSSTRHAMRSPIRWMTVLLAAAFLLVAGAPRADAESSAAGRLSGAPAMPGTSPAFDAESAQSARIFLTGQGFLPMAQRGATLTAGVLTGTGPAAPLALAVVLLSTGAWLMIWGRPPRRR